MKRLWSILKKIRVLLLVFVLAATGLITYHVWEISSGLPGSADFYLRRRKYESIVSKARTTALAPGAQSQTRIDDLLVDIERNQSGSYTVTITTVDRHHAGAYGYVFSEIPATPHPNPNYPDHQTVDNSGDMPFVDTAVIGQGGRWWVVYNDLL
jgi:hypothetical protein